MRLFCFETTEQLFFTLLFSMEIPHNTEEIFQLSAHIKGNLKNQVIFFDTESFVSLLSSRYIKLLSGMEGLICDQSIWSELNFCTAWSQKLD